MAKSTNVAITRFIKKMDRLEAFASDEAYYALERIGEEAVDFMQQENKNQENATDFSRDAQVAGLNQGPGRIRTGAMYDSIDYWDTSVGSGETGSRLSIGFGYRNAPMANDGKAPYALYQDEGFLNKWVWRRPLLTNKPFYDRDNKSNNWHMTEGMFTMRDAAFYVRNFVRPKIAREASSAIARRMRGV